ncbi:unnamed protein product [Effrenium voratum]|nr:unnamed protein product [Effrenium voratum]
MRAMLQSLDGVEFLDAHGESKDFCAEQNFSWPACEKTSSFLSAAVQATWKVATIRDPFERFMASVNEHGKWSSCDGEVCQDEIEKAKDLARTLATQFPGTYRSCEHPTMSYFLSATDLNGNPVVWDMLLEVDDLSSELQKLSELTGWALNTEQENSSGDDDIKRQYFDAIFQDDETRCSVCKVYAQALRSELGSRETPLQRFAVGKECETTSDWRVVYKLVLLSKPDAAGALMDTQGASAARF